MGGDKVLHHTYHYRVIGCHACGNSVKTIMIILHTSTEILHELIHRVHTFQLPGRRDHFLTFPFINMVDMLRKTEAELEAQGACSLDPPVGRRAIKVALKPK